MQTLDVVSVLLARSTIGDAQLLRAMISNFMNRIDTLSRASSTGMARRFYLWTQLPLSPHAEELKAGLADWTSLCQLRAVETQYPSLEEYFERYYSLLRAEAFIPLSEVLPLYAFSPL